MLRFAKIWVVIAAAVAVSVSPGLAGDGRTNTAAVASPIVSPVAVPQSMPPAPELRPRLVQGGACADACHSQFNQCRVSTKGDPRCNAALTGCLQRCLSGKGR